MLPVGMSIDLVFGIYCWAISVTTPRYWGQLCQCVFAGQEPAPQLGWSQWQSGSPLPSRASVIAKGWLCREFTTFHLNCLGVYVTSRKLLHSDQPRNGGGGNALLGQTLPTWRVKAICNLFGACRSCLQPRSSGSILVPRDWTIRYQLATVEHGNSCI